MFCFKILCGINNFSHVFLMRPKSVKIAYWVSLTWWPLTCDWWSVTTLAVLKSGKVGLITNEQNSAQFWPQVNGNFRWQPQSIIDIVVFVKTITIATSIFIAEIQIAPSSLLHFSEPLFIALIRHQICDWRLFYEKPHERRW